MRCCATSKDVPAEQYHLCFVYDDSDDEAQTAPQVAKAPQAKKANVKK